MHKQTEKVIQLVMCTLHFFLDGCVSGGRWKKDDLDIIIKYIIFRNGINWSLF